MWQRTAIHRLLPPALALTLLLLTCAKNPVTGKREISLVSSAQEEEIGREGHAAIVEQFGMYDDPKTQEYVTGVGTKLARVSHLPDLEWHFTVLDDPVVNAFALPGGYIYITRGILAHLNSEAQLAGVLGHEIGHVTARHSAQRITQQQLAGLGLGLASIFSEGFRRYGGAAQTALGLVFLKYGRDDENQADELGIEYAVKAAYDPNEVPATYSMLKRVSDRAGQRLPGFLSTHPDPGDRENRTRTLAARASAGRTGLEVGEASYLQGLEDLVYGQDPRSGFFEGTNYYHPSLRFQIGFPSGWKVQDQRAAVVAVEPNQRAGMQLSLAPPESGSPAEYVAELRRSGKITDASGGGETIGGYPAWAGRVSVTGQDGQPVILAAVFIRKSPEHMFEILGRSAVPRDEDEAQIFTSARSFRELTDPARLAVSPDRVHVTTPPPGTSTFETAVARLGPQALELEETAILNNRFPEDQVQQDQLIKIVEPGKKI
jgi:predicted Zn-dependent protease